MNIAIIPGLLYDDDFKYFDDTTYAALDGVMNDIIAKMIKAYIDNPNAEPEIVEAINAHVGKSVISYTLHLEFEKRKIFDLLKTIQPDTLVQTDAAYKEKVLNDLEFVYNNVDNIVTVIPARTRKQLTEWRSALSMVGMRMSAAGTNWKVPDMFYRLEANSDLFYSAREKDRNLPTNSIISLRDKWMMALRAIQWDNYCNSKGVAFDKRTAF